LPANNNLKSSVFLCLLFSFFALGGKTEPLFLIASVPVLYYFLWAEIPLYPFLVFATAIAINVSTSIDSSASYFLGIQYIVYSIAFFVFHTAFKKTQEPFFCFLVVASGATLAVTFLQWIHSDNLSGFLPVNYNFNAVWMAVSALCLAGHAASDSISGRRKIGEFALSFGLAFLVALGLSRSALIGLVLGGFILLLNVVPASRRSLFFSFVLLFAALLYLSLSPRIHLSQELDFTYGRWNIWKAAYHSLGDHPLTGYGLGNFESGYLRHAQALPQDMVRFGKTTRFAHCDFLQWGVETGLLEGAILFCLGLFPLIQGIRRRPSIQHLSFYVAYLCMALTACVNITLQMPFLMLLALYFAAGLISADSQTKYRMMPMIFKQLLALFILMSLSLLSWRSFLLSNRGATTWLHFLPHDAQAWHLAGVEAKTWPEAIYDQENAVRWATGQLYYHEALARAYAAVNRWNDSALQYQKSLELSPNRAVDWLGLGQALFSLHQPAEAEKCYVKARAIEPAYWQAEFRLAQLWASQGRRAEALFLLRQLDARHQAWIDQVALLHPSAWSPYEHEIVAFDASQMTALIKALNTADKNK